ncbi:hypothetical protein GTG28_15440 [Vibrio sp. OCN044]|uniref:Flagellar M-ring protein n=1 Tax=Vibrio tetraodonis subsp. pristinus TaxID=2695891 RepID=A0A6L8LXU2_9VIBR|nr:flagellar M-ring protein FliF C-terminal domain-containing protein [Vibrio tetraodonis]MYM60625.1 hypothetical protein [Vibrio tetraodonis subsp. pristinus]
MEISKKGKYLLVFGSLAIIILSIITYMYFVGKEKVLLFSDQPQKTLALISNSLNESGIEFSYPPSGVNGLMISEGDIGKVKVQLANDNVFGPKIVGFELFNDSQPSMSELYQKVNYQRALQGELEKSILLIQGVESARVHLAIPREKTFSRTKTKVKAAITLGLDTDGMANMAMIMRSVRELVSGSVNNLSLDDISILNNKGEVLSSNDDGMIEGTLGLKSQLEKQVEMKIVSLLGSYFSAQDIGVSAWVTLNNDQVSEVSQGVDERFDPVVKQRTTEVQLGKNKKSSKEITDEQFVYREVTRNIDYAKGSIERLTVSIITPATKYLTEDKLRQLITSALSLDYSRGDLLTVVIADRPNLDVSPDPVKVVSPTPVDNLQSVQKTSHASFSIFSGPYLVILITILTFISAVLLVQNRKLKALEKLTPGEEKKVLEGLNMWLEEKQIEQR